MSRENVELVRLGTDAWVSGDVETAYAMWDPDIEWDTTHFAGWPENEVYRGTEVRGFLEEWLATWDSYEASVEDVIDAGEDRVVVLWRQRMVGRGSRVPVELESAQIWTIRDRLVVRIDNYTDRAEALEAVGVGE